MTNMNYTNGKWTEFEQHLDDSINFIRSSEWNNEEQEWQEFVRLFVSAEALKKYVEELPTKTHFKLINDHEVTTWVVNIEDGHKHPHSVK